MNKILDSAQAMHLPDYRSGSIVNLMASLTAARGGNLPLYPPLSALNPHALADSRNIVLIVIDGLGYDYLCRSRAAGALHRHLIGRLTSVFPSTTASAIPVFLTGLAPQQHALTGWFSYFKEIDRVITVLPLTERASGKHLVDLGIDAQLLFDHGSVFEVIATPSYAVVPEHIAFSTFNLIHCKGAAVRPYSSLSQFFSMVGQIIDSDIQSKYIYAYWPKLDHIAHDKGIGSRAVAAHFAELDAAFAKFLVDLEGSDSTVIVTADHGMIDSGPKQLIELDGHPKLAQTLARPLCGERRMAYCYVLPSKHQQFERYVQDQLGDYVTLYKSEELVEQGLFGLGQVHPRLRERIGDYALIMKENYIIKDWLPGERHYTHIGMHGGVSRQEMYVPLIVAEV
ncbi:MAG: alkaline phosphatase family protein [Pseudomonadota bacterium]